MEKKKYMKPSMKAYEEVNVSLILCASGGDRRAPKDYDDEMGYIPGAGTEMNSLA